eukprot:8527643-Heterocapsa_arctica.AAC.1
MSAPSCTRSRRSESCSRRRSRSAWMRWLPPTVERRPPLALSHGRSTRRLWVAFARLVHVNLGPLDKAAAVGKKRQSVAVRPTAVRVR